MKTIRGNNAVITEDNQGPILAIATWFLMTVMILAVFARVTIKLAIRRQIGIEDFTIIAALLLGIAQAIAISLAIQYGLGQRETQLNSVSLSSIDQAQYAANLLYILTLGFAKVSILQLLRALAVSEVHRKAMKFTIYIVIAWTISSFFTLVFQCGTSQPWNTHSDHCINRFAFWIAISPVDIITELMIVLLPIFMMMPVQVKLGRKVVVVVAFVFRLAVITVTIVRLALLKNYFFSTDMTFDSIASGIATQCILSITITTACIPSLKPFLDGFESGMLGVTLKNPGGISVGNSYEMSNTSNSANKSTRRSRMTERKDRAGYLTTISGQRPRPQQDETGSVDSGQSDAMIIRRTDEWNIQYEISHTSSLEPRKEMENCI